MSNFLLWLIAQNTTQSLAHQMQKDDPKLWNIAQFSLFADGLSIGWYILFLVAGLAFALVIFHMIAV